MIRKMRFRLVFLVSLLLISFASFAQPALPDMLGSTQNGVNILTWDCQYNGIKSIAVQRSVDSFFNFVTIGYVKNLKKGTQAFIDGHPQPGNNWYKLLIVFSSDLTWYSNSIKMVVDSAELLKQKTLPPNDSLQKFASKVTTVEIPKDLLKEDVKKTIKTATTAGVDTTGNKVTSVKLVMDTTRKVTATSAAAVEAILQEPEEDLSSYVKSQYIFTNPFTGHVNVEIPEAANSFYSIKFYDKDDKQVLFVPRIRQSSIIIDKRNFQHKGIYKFDLIKEKEVLETGHVTIF